MTVTSRVSTLARCSSLYLLLVVVGAAACSSGHRIVVKKAQRICVSDEGTVRACLVPDKGDETTNNIPIGNTGCYWFRLKGDEDESQKEKQYRREATGRPRQFTFLVVNQCAAAVDVKFEIAELKQGDLAFLPGRCDREEIPDEKKLPPATDPKRIREMFRDTVATGGDVSVQCHTLPYRKKTFGGRRLQRTFNLVATGYGGKAIDPVEYDPEVELEKAGSTP